MHMHAYWLDQTTVSSMTTALILHQRVMNTGLHVLSYNKKTAYHIHPCHTWPELNNGRQSRARVVTE